MSLADIKTAVNLGRDGTDFRSQILLDHPQRMTVIVRDQIHGQSQVTETSRSADTVKVRLGILREIKVDNNIDTLNINTTREEIGRYEMTRPPVTELVEHPVTVCLLHFGMYVETGVSQFRYLLGKELDAVNRVTEDDGLVNLELGEEGVKAVNLLAFLDVGIELGNTPKGKFFHQIDRIGLWHVLGTKVLNGDGEGGTE